MERFADAWQRGERPDLREYLQGIEAERRALLVELVHEDLAYRLQAGESAGVEDYVEQFPELSGDPAVLLDLLAAEYLLRERCGEAVTIAEYQRRFPAQAEALPSRVERWRRRRAGDTDSTVAPVGQRLDPSEVGTLTHPPAVPITEHPTLASPAGAMPQGELVGAPTTTLVPPAPMALEGVAVPGYQVLGELGKGGMGVVYQARQLALDRVVALKMILAGGHARPEERQRFLGEAQAVARLQHANIIQVFEVNEAQGLPYFSLEYCPGGSLEKQLSGTPWEPMPAARLVQTLARAMDYAHQQGIVHRDLKPANVLLSADGTPKVTDFGLAKRLDSPGQTRPEDVMGTPSYMAPEQAGGKPEEVGPAADVYALGAILYELLTGRPPFKGPTALDTILQVMADDPVPVRRLQPKTPRDLETICHKCLEKDPSRRYASALALAEDLNRFQVGEPVAARPAGLARRGIKWCRRRPAAAALLGVALLAAVGAAVGVPLGFAQLRAVAQGAKREANALRTSAAAASSLQQAQEALARQDPEGARALLAQVENGISEDDLARDPQLVEYKDTALRLRRDLSRREAARKNFQAVPRLRDEAMFHLYRDVFSAMESSSLPQCQQAARKALGLYGLPGAALAKEDVAGLKPEEIQELHQRLYEVSVVLAESLVRPRPGQAPPERKRLAAEALAILDGAAALAPDPAALHRRRARYLALQGEDAAAARERAAAGKAVPTTAVDWFFGGCEKAFEQRDWKEALAHFETALHLDRQMFWARFFHAFACQQLNAPDKAIASLAVCAAQRPDFIWIYQLRAPLYARLNAFAAAADDFAAAEALHPSDTERYVLYVNRGYAALKQKALQKAAADLEKAVRLKPDQPGAHVNLAEAYLELHDPGRAFVHLDKAISMRPRDAQLYRLRASAHWQRRDWQAALRDLDEAIRRTPPEKGATSKLALDHLERAEALYNLHRYPQALLACNQSRALNPRDPVAHRLHGEVLVRLGCFEEALAAYDHCATLSPEKLGRDFFLQRARVREELHDSAGLVEEYTGALHTAPQDVSLYVRRGWAYLDTNATELALHDFEKAIQLDPKQGDAYLGRAETWARRRNYRLATANAEEALRQDPHSGRLSYNAARVFAEALDVLEGLGPLGDPSTAQVRSRYQERAVACLRQALTLWPRQERPSFWKDRVLRDPVFHSLKATVGFRRLAADFSTQTP